MTGTIKAPRSTLSDKLDGIAENMLNIEGRLKGTRDHLIGPPEEKPVPDSKVELANGLVGRVDIIGRTIQRVCALLAEIEAV